MDIKFILIIDIQCYVIYFNHLNSFRCGHWELFQLYFDSHFTTPEI